MPTMTVQSAAMRRLRRELETSRRMAALAPTGGIAKKPSPTPTQFSSPLPPRSAPTTPAPRRAAGGTALVAHARRPSPAASCTRHAAAPTAEAAAGLTSSTFGKGAQVRVRTPLGTQRLVFWLGAVVVSAADEDGYLRVVYNDGNFPRDNPSGIARVARKDVKDDVPRAAAAAAASAGSSAVTTDRSARRPSQDKAAQRPTVAGKKLPLLKKLEKEMRSASNAILASSW